MKIHVRPIIQRNNLFLNPNREGHCEFIFQLFVPLLSVNCRLTCICLQINRGGLLLFTTVTSDTRSTGVKRDFTNPTSFSLDASFQEKAAFAPWWSNLITGTVSQSSNSHKDVFVPKMALIIIHSSNCGTGI